MNVGCVAFLWRHVLTAQDSHKERDVFPLAVHDDKVSPAVAKCCKKTAERMPNSYKLIHGHAAQKNHLQQMWSRSNNNHHGRGTASCGPFVHVLDALDSRCEHAHVEKTWILAWSPEVFRGGAASCDHWSCCPFPHGDVFQHMVLIHLNS